MDKSMNAERLPLSPTDVVCNIPIALIIALLANKKRKVAISPVYGNNAPRYSFLLMKASRLGPHSRFLSFLSEAAKLFGIAIACLLAMGAAVFVSIKTGMVVPARWFGLFFWTCFLLWFVLRQHKRDLRQLRFWLALSGFLIVHVFAFSLVLRAYPAWPMIWFMFIVVIEGPLVLVALQNLIHPSGTRRGA